MSEIFSRISSNFTQKHTGSEVGFNTDRSPDRSDIKVNPLNESFSGIVTSFTVYKLLNELIKPFNALEAFRAGIINDQGDYIVNIQDLPPAKRGILTPFNRMVIGIKRLIRSSGSAKLKADYSYIQTAARAMAFECQQLGGDKELFLEEIEKVLYVLTEDGIGNSVGEGNIAGGPQVGTPNPALAGNDSLMGGATGPVVRNTINKQKGKQNVVPQS